MTFHIISEKENKSATLTGVNSGKNFALAKHKGHGTLTLKADVKNATLKIVPAKGWTLSEIYINDNTTGMNRSLSGNGYSLSSGPLYWGKLLKNHSY